MIEIQLVGKNRVELPRKATRLSGAVDLHARGVIQWYTANNVQLNEKELEEVNWRFKNKKPIRLLKGQRILIDTDLFLANCPEDFRGDVKSRSGLALKHGVFVLNADGLVDADYRKCIGVILSNVSNEAFEINFNDRIAQFESRRGEDVTYEFVNEIVPADSERKDGFGHTGK
jgi:dUTP pyrophosphatase